MKIIKLNLGHLDDFCRLRLQLFQELNEIKNNEMELFLNSRL